MKTPRTLAALAGLLVSLPVLAQEAPPKETKPPKAALSAHKITASPTCPALRSYYASILAEEMAANFYWDRWNGYAYGGGYGGGYGAGYGVGSGRGDGGFGGPRPPAAEPTAPSAAPAASKIARDSSGGSLGAGDSSREAAPSHFTGTNNQEQNVDELDFVKTDGKFIYVLNGTALHIYKSWPAEEIAKVSSYELGGYPSSFFLYKDRVLVVSSAENTKLRYGYGSRAVVLDVSDRAKPKEIRRYDVEGDLVNGRMIGDEVFLVTNQYFEWPERFYELLDEANATLFEDAEELFAGAVTGDPRPTLRKLAVSAMERALAKEDITSMMPQYIETTAGKEAGSAKAIYGCDDIFHPAQPVQYGMMGVIRFDLGEDAKSISGAGVFGQGWNVYASEQSLYLTTSDAMFGWPYYDGFGFYGTEIHKFSLGGKAGVSYAGSGKVRGELLNQFSMSEHKGHLRIATTTWNDYTGEQKNHLTIFQQSGKSLVKVGAINNIAKGESIQAVRMMGDKGYMVTFQQTDPLFTLDLSNPKEPKIVGELKIPGYSSYIHPMGKDHLLTVGMDADNSGRVLGAQVAIFDVSDMKNPKQVQKYTFKEGYTDSTAVWDHHAFTYYNNRLAIPLQSSKQVGGVNLLDFQLALFHVDPVEGISETGRIDHKDLAEASCKGNAQAKSGDCAWAYAPISRSVMIDDLLFSISDFGIKANSLKLPKTTYASLLFSAK